ncbi:MAG: NADH-quinone oxidoreductase subunit J [Thermodesulfobacteriota bacterium]
MNAVFYISSIIAVVATAMVVTRVNVVHALLYLIVSLLAVALIFFVLGAPFVAALEVLIYAGAIMVLFVFVIMMLNLGARGEAHQKALLSPAIWIGPGILAIVLLGELIYVLLGQDLPRTSGGEVSPKEVSLALFGPYVLGVELASVLLLAGLVGAYHLGRRVVAPRKEGS